MNIKRFTSALIGLPLVALVLIFGNQYVIDISFSIIAVLSLNEFYNAFKQTSKPMKWIGYVFAIAIAFIHVIPTAYTKNSLQLLVPNLITILFLVIVVTDMKYTIKDMAITLLGIAYILGFIVFIPLLRGIENGSYFVWYIIVIAWGTDIFAYLVGKKFGKHKFSKISPKKSIEGCVAGTIGAILLMLAYTFFVNNYLGMEYSYLYIGIIALILSLVGQIGDFAASSIKRYVDIKDFSNLIPGHGGMLDRIDSLIFLAPFAYALFTLL